MSTIEWSDPLLARALELEPPPVPRCIGRRVDALTIAYKIEMSDATRALIRERSEAGHGGTAELVIGNFAAAIKRPAARGSEKWPIENADVRGLIEFRATAGWNLEIIVGAPYLATHSLRKALELAHASAAAFGSVKAKRLRRFDLAADFDGFPLEHADAHGFVIPHRARLGAFHSSEVFDDDRSPAELARLENLMQPIRRVFQSADATVTGFVICPGGVVLARIYDKSAELLLSGREEKRILELATWQRNGWDGRAQVTRVEFQIRGTALDEMRLRDPDELPAALDAVWGYLTSRIVGKGSTWLRLMAPETATRRSRCELDPRWAAVQAVIFDHESSPVRRERRRGGATWAQSFGSMLSALGASGSLGRVDLSVFRDELGRAPEARRSGMSRAWGLSLLLDVHLTAAIHCADSFFGAARGVTELAIDPDKPPTGARAPSDAALELGERLNAVWARFASEDDRALPLPPHYHAEPSDGGWMLRLESSSGILPPFPDPLEGPERAALELS